jgi:hypothetical protein
MDKHGNPGCSCGTDEEHEALVARVNESYLQDDDRYILRLKQNASILRAKVVIQLNGHNN